jgi:hypothetical protein
MLAFIIVDDSENGSLCLKHVLKELESKADKAVSMGNHKLLDISPEEGVQNGLKTSSFEVDSRTDVADNSVFWEAFDEEGDLSLEVLMLLGRGDPCVDDSLLCSVWGWRGVLIDAETAMASIGSDGL